jgi:hypothetical protein
MVAAGEKLLSAREIANPTEPGRYADGGGLYLAVSAGGRRVGLARGHRAAMPYADVPGFMEVLIPEFGRHDAFPREVIEARLPML